MLGKCERYEYAEARYLVVILIGLAGEWVFWRVMTRVGSGNGIPMIAGGKGVRVK